MTKSELREMIRECLREELSKRSLKESQELEPITMRGTKARKMKMYCADDGSGEYELVFEADGKVVDRQFAGSFENVMIMCFDFFEKNSKKFGLETIVNTLEVNLNHTFY
jgi:hypothetical protein